MKMPILRLPILLAAFASSSVSAETKIRVGHFPNITHAQGVIAHALSRQGKGWFEQRLGPDTKIEWFVYNAGPSAMEAIFAKSIDLTYVGSGPALNAYTKSNGQEIRLIAGAANGGSGLVVQPDQNLKAAMDFRGKKIATPQLGNTQDISCRAWLRDGAAGRVTAKVAPLPWPSLCARMLPPCISTIALLMARPRPRPSRRISSCSKAAKIFSRNSGSIPTPLSVISTVIEFGALL